MKLIDIKARVVRIGVLARDTSETREGRQSGLDFDRQALYYDVLAEIRHGLLIDCTPKEAAEAATKAAAITVPA